MSVCFERKISAVIYDFQRPYHRSEIDIHRKRNKVAVVVQVVIVNMQALNLIAERENHFCRARIKSVHFGVPYINARHEIIVVYRV